MKKRNNFKNIGVIVFLVSIVVLAVDFMFVFSNFSANNEPDEELSYPSDIEEKQESREEEISLTDLTVENLIQMISLNGYSFRHYYPESINNTYFALFYKNSEIYAKDIPNKVKMYMIVQNFRRQDKELRPCEYSISEGDFIKSYQEIFGRDAHYNFVGYDQEFAPGLIKKDQQIVLLGCFGDTSGPSYIVTTKFVSATKTDNAIYLYEAVALRDEYNEKEYASGVYDFYNDVHQTKLVATTTEEELFEKYLEHLSQYKYTFKLEFGNYYFEKVERIQ